MRSCPLVRSRRARIHRPEMAESRRSASEKVRWKSRRAPSEPCRSCRKLEAHPGCGHPVTSAYVGNCPRLFARKATDRNLREQSEFMYAVSSCVRHLQLLSPDSQEGFDLVPTAEERLQDTGVEVSARILGHMRS